MRGSGRGRARSFGKNSFAELPISSDVAFRKTCRGVFFPCPLLFLLQVGKYAIPACTIMSAQNEDKERVFDKVRVSLVHRLFMSNNASQEWE